MKKSLSLLACLAMTACGAQDAFYPVPLMAPSERIAIAYSAVEVREASMPSYSSEQDIYVQAKDGGLRAIKGAAWADRPARGLTQDLAQALAAQTGARVAAEPWPFQSYPQVALDLRVTSFAVTSEGAFTLAGQYFVADQNGGRERTGSFRFSEPLPEGYGSADIAAARGVVTQKLAREIAQTGLR